MIFRDLFDDNLIAEIFDDDGNGEVDFKEFIQGVSQFSVKGDKDTKLRFDNSHDGYLIIIETLIYGPCVQ